MVNYTTNRVAHGHPFKCPSCNKRFCTNDLRADHIDKRHTPFHDNSNKYLFTSSGGLNSKPCRFLSCKFRFKIPEHLASSRQFSKTINTADLPGYKIHMDTQHAFCPICDRYFVDDNALSKHCADSPQHQRDDYRCLECSQKFHTIKALATHACQLPCGDPYDGNTCEAVFQYRRDLESHQRRRQHGPFRINDGDNTSVRCLACPRKFQSVAAMVSHLESGKCESGINRTIVDMAVMAFDPDEVIHNRVEVKKMIESEESSKKERMMVVYVKDAKGCWTCNECGKIFEQMKGLQMHMESPVHRKKAYHSPPNRKATERKCLEDGYVMAECEEEAAEIMMSIPSTRQRSRRFKTLSALVLYLQNCGEAGFMERSMEFLAQRMEARMFGVSTRALEER